MSFVSIDTHSDKGKSPGTLGESRGRSTLFGVLGLAGVVLAALVLRITFFTGYMGSDDITYTDGAVRVLLGSVQRTDYIGALRYGVDVPMALFMGLFGADTHTASMWSMLTSLLDVALIGGCGWLLWGPRVGVGAAFVAALLPMHINLAGRPLADAPLAAFITLSIFCFIAGVRRDSKVWYFCAGLALGGVFWIKQAVIVYGVVFLLLAVAMRTWSWRWSWGAAGALAMLIGNCLLMAIWQGDPLHVFRVSGEGLSEYGGRADIDDSAWLYFRYLFLDVRHTWLLAFTALAGAFLALRSKASAADRRGGLVASVWAGGLILLFSFAVISTDPVRFIMKQSNYMLIFTAPLCLLSGFLLARLRPRFANVVAVVYASGGIVLGALAQQDVRVFTANSVQVVEYARTHPEVEVYATSNAYRRALFERSLSKDLQRRLELKNLGRLTDQAGTLPRVAVVDTQNIGWGNNPFGSIDRVPDCWKRVMLLDVPEVEGAGRYVLRGLHAVAAWLPGPVRGIANAQIDRLTVPRPTYVFEVPDDCGLPGKPAAQRSRVDSIGIFQAMEAAA